MTRKFSEEEVAKIIEMYRAGYTLKKISDATNRTISSVNNKLHMVTELSEFYRNSVDYIPPKKITPPNQIDEKIKRKIVWMAMQKIGIDVISQRVKIGKNKIQNSITEMKDSGEFDSIRYQLLSSKLYIDDERR